MLKKCLTNVYNHDIMNISNEREVIKMKQIKYRDIKNNVVCGGIRLDNGDVICACCGSLIPVNKQNVEHDFELIKEYNDWVDFTTDIIA